MSIMNIRNGDRVLIPRTDGRWTPGTVHLVFNNRRLDDCIIVKLDELGSRGQALGKETSRIYLIPIEGE